MVLANRIARQSFVRLCAHFARVVVPLVLVAPLVAQDVGFEGPGFAGAGATPTEAKPQSKLWFNDGIWWGSLWNTADAAFQIHRLDFTTHTWIDTNVVIDTRPNSHSDIKWDGTRLYVVSHEFSLTGASGNPIQVRRYSYNTATDTYSADAGFPVTVGDFSTEAAVIDKDSAGTVWVAWTQSLRVRIAHSTTSDTVWSPSVVLPTNTTNISADDLCSLIAFNGDRIGVAWSDQVVNAFRFSVHVDGAADTAWSAAENVSTAETDDHMHLAADSTGRVFLAGKNGGNNLLLFVRPSGGGAWSRFVITQPTPILTRPIVLLNEVSRTIHIFATGQDTGEVFEKTSSLDNISFASGNGTIRLRDASTLFRISNPTSTKQNITPDTGLVVLAHHDTTGFYWHHEVAPVVAAPVANFSAAPTTGTAPLNVTFTDTSTGSITSRSWSFGDGGTSTATNPSHSYAAGTYTVSLTVTGPGGSDTETKTNLIVVSAPTGAPVANFSAAPTTGTAPLNVTFTDTSTGTISSRSWSFGDGGTSTATNPSHSYAAGTYTVSLTVTGPGGSDTETKTNLIVVSAPTGAPVANFSAAPTTGTAPLNVTFTDTSTGTISSRSWNFGDGGTSTATNPSHSYAAGTYTVSLTVTGPGGSDTETKTNLIVVTPATGGGPTLAAPVPGTAGVSNSITVSGVTPGSVVGFYTGQVLGTTVIVRPTCPQGVPIGMTKPYRLLGTAHANASGVATLTFSVPSSAAGKLYYFQVVDQVACRASNLLSEQF